MAYMLPESWIGESPNLDISRVGGFHRQGIQGHSCTWVPQGLDNAADGSLQLARRVKTFWHLLGGCRGNELYLSSIIPKPVQP
jgi:hypothetical protein